MRTSLALLVFSLAFGQAPASVRASIEGTAIELGSARGVAHARIVAAKVGGAVADYRTLTTDTSGRFAFRDLTPGTYRLYAQREGYLPAEYGRRPANTAGTPITLNDRQAISDIVIPMTLPGVITGHVLDDGRPVQNALVRVLKSRMIEGERTLAESATDWAQTDDTGEYRVFGLTPGRYYVNALPPAKPRIEGDTVVTPVMPRNSNNSRSEERAPLAVDTLTSAALNHDVFVPVYYPSTTDQSSAGWIDVGSGVVVSGIDLTVARTATFRVSGHLAGAVAPAGQTFRVRATDGHSRANVATADSQGKTGAFELKGLPPGVYYVFAQLTSPPGPPPAATARPAVPRGFARIEVVDHDLDDLVLPVRSGVTLIGRVSLEGTTLTASSARIGGIQLLPVPFGIEVQRPSGMPIQADGSFSMPDILPGDYRFRIAPLIGVHVWVKSARFGAVDALAATFHVDADPQGPPLEIQLSSNMAALDALVVDGSRRPVAGALVVLIPDVARRSRPELFLTANTDSVGRAHIDGIGAGEYRVVATEDVEAAAWLDPDVIRDHENQGEVVRFQENGKQDVTLRVTP